jgi:thymidylate synthase
MHLKRQYHVCSKIANLLKPTKNDIVNLEIGNSCQGRHTMTYHDEAYNKLAEKIRAKGILRGDRTGTGTISLFSEQMRFDLSDGSFPLLTGKRVPFRIVMEELFWFLRGETNIRPLVRANVHIWDEWPYKAYLKANGLVVPQTGSEEWVNGLANFVTKIGDPDDESFALQWGDLGPVYGSQWRKWRTEDGRVIDQIANLVESLKSSPESRSHIVNAWNPGEYEWLRQNSLPPCHVLWQCYVAEGRLSLHLYQRSCDFFLGVPFNIASYSALLLMLAHVTGLAPGELVWTGGDVHIYANHTSEMEELLSRELRPSPTLKILGPVSSIDDFCFNEFELLGYDPHPAIKAPIAV